MNILLTILTLIVIFGFIVVIHEFGHFLASKLMKVEVEEFAIGFGKTIFKKRVGDTLYKFNMLPLGGYVKVLGDEDAASFTHTKAREYTKSQITKYQKLLNDLGLTPEVSILRHIEVVNSSKLEVEQKKELYSYIKGYLVPRDPDNILNKGFWPRFFIFIAGILMNLLAACVIFTIYLSIYDYKEDMYKIADYPFVGVEDKVVKRPLVNKVYRKDLRDLGFDVNDENGGIIIMSINGEVIEDKDDFNQKWEKIENQKADIEFRYLANNKTAKIEDIVINSSEYDINIEPDLQGKILLSEIYEGTSASDAGIESRDTLISIDFEEVTYDSNEEFTDMLKKIQNTSHVFTLLSQDGQKREVDITLSDEEDRYILGAMFQVNQPLMVNEYHLDYSDNKILSGIFHTINVFGYNPVAFAEIIGISYERKDISIASQSVSSIWGVGEHLNTLVVNRNYRTIINLAGHINVVLAFMNLLPIPLLDGGQILFLVIEKIRGRRLSAKMEERIAKISFFLLMGFSLIIILKDIWIGFIGEFIRGIF